MEPVDALIHKKSDRVRKEFEKQAIQFGENNYAENNIGFINCNRNFARPADDRLSFGREYTFAGVGLGDFGRLFVCFAADF